MQMEGGRCFPAWTTFILEAKCTHRAPLKVTLKA